MTGGCPQSVFSLGNGLSSVEAWFSTALDIEEVLAGTGGDQLYVVVADVNKSFDTGYPKVGILGERLAEPTVRPRGYGILGGICVLMAYVKTIGILSSSVP